MVLKIKLAQVKYARTVYSSGNAKIRRRRLRSVDGTEFGHFTSLFFQRTAKKCTKSYNARAQLLFCSLSLLFGAVLVAVVVVVCLSSLFTDSRQNATEWHMCCMKLTSSQSEMSQMI